jgi:hypothetical protein
MSGLVPALLEVAVMGSAVGLGFRLGSRYTQRELLRVRVNAAKARHDVHELTRQTFVAMAEHAEWYRQQSVDHATGAVLERAPRLGSHSGDV